jgi:hypothetical protein
MSISRPTQLVMDEIYSYIIIFIIRYVCLSVCQHISVRFSLDGFALNFILRASMKTC